MSTDAQTAQSKVGHPNTGQSANGGGPTTSFGDQQVAVGARQGLVNDVFARVADNYDTMNDLMSGGMHRLWKDAMVTWLNPSPTRSVFNVVDVAGGTGDIAQRIVARSQGTASVLLYDISGEMLRVGRDRLTGANARRASAQSPSEAFGFIQGNAECLALPGAGFDAYTIAFGIRNVTQIENALTEAHRVLKPGGRFMCLEFSQVQVPGFDTLYDRWSDHVIPRLGEWIAKDRAAYEYLVESIRRFPTQVRFADMVSAAGFKRVTYRNLSGGIAAIHSGWKV